MTNVNASPLFLPSQFREKLGIEAEAFMNELIFVIFQLRERSIAESDSLGRMQFSLYLIQGKPSTETAVTGGTVIKYDTDTETVYRFVPSPYDYSEDAFYTDFDGSNVTNIIVSRSEGGDPIDQLEYTLYLLQGQPGTETAIAGGTVIQYSTDDETVYRFVPDPYDYDADAFYADFDGVTLSNIIASRK